MNQVDLHAHTTASDGLYEPDQLIERAYSKKLSAVAVTDHDTVEGLNKAIQAGEKWGIEVIPGIEISTRWKQQEIHMLSYFMNIKHPKLKQLLKEQSEIRQERNKQMVVKLNQLGIPITYEEVLVQKKSKQGSSFGRPHIADAMIDKGIVKSMKEAFDRYLGKGKAAYVVLDRISPMEAVELIHTCGGVCVMAHPGIYDADDLIPLLVEIGMDGIEVNHPDHSAEDRLRYQQMAEKYDLIQSAGSDFHGERQGAMHHADLGTCTVPYSVVEQFRALAK